ncbi:universal stress protein [Roseibium alexandrii]|uniref:Universal stress protein E n=1 Tax=Roseibium alexandrii TaxID=388408 RepID=A0A0M7AG10_9HYPH|nr:universal stress protein [Roseibium alexandrii]CTQ73150.1 Universal stress protein E [Roseibium alexandrii]
MIGELRCPKKILAVIDDTDTQIALKSAAELAKAHKAGLEVIACVEPPQDIAIIARLAGRDKDAIIEEMVTRARGGATENLKRVLPDQAIEPRIVVGKAYLSIIRHVGETGCDFVVKAAEPLTGINGYLHASNDQHLLRKCPCPVWLQSGTAEPVPRRVIAAVDLDNWDAAEPDTLDLLNQRVVEAAARVAHAHGAEIIVLHAWDAVGEGMVWAFSDTGDARKAANDYVRETVKIREEAMRQLLKTLRRRLASPNVVLQPLLVRGAVERVIEIQSNLQNADLVVMGTVARTGLSGVFIGNTAENIVNSLKCPVLAVKPEGFVSPLLTP